MPQQLAARYRIVVPMFLGDANQNVTGLRPPSIKGALRFWWRALNWGRLYQEAGHNEVRAFGALSERERVLFGAAANDSGDGQARFLMRVDGANVTALDTARLGQRYPLGPWRAYLLGQGLAKNGYSRGALTGEFSVELMFRAAQPPADVDSVEEALLLFGLLGGLGSRSRRGLGSVAITELSGGKLSAPADETAWRAALKSLMAPITLPPWPPFTAFSSETRVDISQRGDAAWDIIEEVARAFQLYRSCGRVNRAGIRAVNGVDVGATPRYWSDHNTAFDVANGNRPSRHPRRVVFGLPHNYFFSTPPKGNVRMEPSGNSRARRASPLMLHLHAFNDGKVIAVQSLFPAIFLPAGDQITMKRKQRNGCSVVGKVPVSPAWDEIMRYLDSFNDRTTVRP